MLDARGFEILKQSQEFLECKLHPDCMGKPEISRVEKFLQKSLLINGLFALQKNFDVE